MKSILIAATAALALTAGAANARGCLKGALVGGVAWPLRRSPRLGGRGRRLRSRSLYGASPLSPLSKVGLTCA